MSSQDDLIKLQSKNLFDVPLDMEMSLDEPMQKVNLDMSKIEIGGGISPFKLEQMTGGSSVQEKQVSIEQHTDLTDLQEMEISDFGEVEPVQLGGEKRSLNLVGEFDEEIEPSIKSNSNVDKIFQYLQEELTNFITKYEISPAGNTLDIIQKINEMDKPEEIIIPLFFTGIEKRVEIEEPSFIDESTLMNSDFFDDLYHIAVLYNVLLETYTDADMVDRKLQQILDYINANKNSYKRQKLNTYNSFNSNKSLIPPNIFTAIPVGGGRNNFTKKHKKSKRDTKRIQIKKKNQIRKTRKVKKV